jgi:hypothetical protein
MSKGAKHRCSVVLRVSKTRKRKEKEMTPASEEEAQAVRVAPGDIYTVHDQDGAFLEIKVF